jgi:MFS family permease
MIAAACYSAFGYAYIIPATYLPSLARVYVPDPLVFGWIWPLFGVAAAISTVIAAPMARTVSPRKLWINSQWLLAIGVLVPTLKVSAPFLLLSAGCAGGSFMVITMAGIREAYRLGQGRETVTIAMMTGCFGIGQIVGPLEVGFFEGSTGSIVLPSLAAAAALTLSNVVLYIQGPGDSREQSNQAQAGR